MPAAPPLVPRGEAAWSMLSLAAMQGAAFFIQLLVAASLSPADFAVVRTVEAWLSPLLVVAAAGLPSLALAWLPVREGAARSALAHRFLGTSLGTGALVAVAAAVVVRLGPPAGTYLSIACGTLVLAAVTRTGTNLLLADGRVRPAALTTATISLVGIPAAAWGARHYGLTGWLAARYLVEGALLVGMLWVGRSWLRRVEAPTVAAGHLIRTGSLLSASLLIRSVTDNLGPMAMTRLGFAGVEPGAFALATVGVAAVLLAPGAVGNLAIRRFAQAARGEGQLGPAIRQGIGVVLGFTVLPCLGFTLAGEAVLGWFFPQYQGTSMLMAVVLWAAPWRAVTALMGGVLVAVNRSGATVWLNLACLSLAAVLQWSLVRRWGVWGSAWAILLTDVATVALYAGVVAIHLRRQRVVAA